jgi:uncharacterized protein (TIGR03085 family)
MAHYAQDERHALAALLLEVGPDAPTLCGDWTTADLAAHLVLRERRPDAAPGILLPPFAGHTERVQRGVRDGQSWAQLVEAVRSGPPVALRPLDEVVNTVEYFVHHEDVRRAREGWQPRSLGAGLEAALWSRFRGLARVLFRHAGVGVELVAPGVGSARAKRGADVVRVEGAPGELVLFGFGRGERCNVELHGDPAAVASLRRAPLGI